MLNRDMLNINELSCSPFTQLNSLLAVVQFCCFQALYSLASKNAFYSGDLLS